MLARDNLNLSGDTSDKDESDSEAEHEQIGNDFLDGLAQKHNFDNHPGLAVQGKDLRAKHLKNRLMHTADKILAQVAVACVPG